MKFKHLTPEQLAEDILCRSTCAVQVGAVLADGWGIHSWGWNSMGRDGYGEHAEAHAMRRANPARLKDSILYVAGRRLKSRNSVISKPCEECQRLCLKVKATYWRDQAGLWHLFQP